MGRASIKSNMGDSQVRENCKDLDSEDKIRRLERRWKRREIILKGSLKHDCNASATRTTVKSEVNKAVLTEKNGYLVEDEVDEDYKFFLDTYLSDIDVVIDNNVDGSDAVVDTGHNNDNDIDSDPQYKKFLENLRKEGNSYVYSCFVENQLVHVRYEGEEEEEEERLHYGLKLDTKMLNGLTQRDETGNVGNTGIDSLRKQTGGSMESQQNMETEKVHCNKRANEDVSGVPNKSCHSDVEFDDVDEDVSGVPNKSCHSDVEFDDVDEDYQLFLNSWTDDDNLVHMGGELMGKTTRVQCDKAFDTREVQCDIDEDYQLFLNSADVVDDDLVFMRDRNISKINKMEGGSNSSDPDLILLEPDEICENTPFISSKTYDSSWFESEMKPRHSREFSAYDHSQFRKKLMEYLERPYDKREYDYFMHELHQRRPKERHLETRQGVIKSYHTHGETKSYLELYPDLSKAIAGLKEQPHRVLFLLRGFIFWLQNVTHNGNFRPWLDESCLEILRKM
ncbi:uncharacterized protein LOC133316512 [Gastrolobium bilobum]|uniref:uncharacterized protein LOC133316512 n=1 Tax=Gastrolobium bilobum TaxID=150636 RepID=UPI002AB24DF6|nr:uncharacterized protein LOC133316512 [Gastrolobium bilobum]XP_061374255.1 uncharacterized protein LOC133316512 [Gastrolobium bilobum]